ncbi:MAG: succinate dehydrogenase assembly factor 2 [Pseudomonadales bacterium]
MTDSAPRQITDGRLRWRSRRGMLELELALQPFVERCLLNLTAADRERFARLLEHDDWDIFEWLQGREPVPDPDLVELIAEIRAAHGGF